MTIRSITLEDRFVQKAGNLVSDMDGEKVMLSIDSGKYYNLGAVGGRIWELLESGNGVEAIVNSLLAEYEIDRTTCQDQVIAFLDSMYRENMIAAIDEVSA